ncbi:MAG: DUF1189 family protein [Candidatus Woesearchaeota archaeon]
MRGEPIPFFSTFGKIFALNDYDDFAEQKVGRSIKYFLKLMILGTILLFIFSIPKLINFSESFDKSLSKFNYLTISLNYSMKEPLIFFEGDNKKQITIDLNSNATTINKGKILVTNSSIIKRSWFGSSWTNTTGYSNIITHKETYKNFFIGFILFMLPSLMLLAYIVFAIKFFIIILLVSFLTFVIARTIRFEVDYLHCFNCTLYPFTIAILLSMMLFPYNIHYGFFRVEWLGYIVSVIFLAIGIQSVGYFSRKPEKRDKIRRKSYVELR